MKALTDDIDDGKRKGKCFQTWKGNSKHVKELVLENLESLTAKMFDNCLLKKVFPGLWKIVGSTRETMKKCATRKCYWPIGLNNFIENLLESS